MNFCNCLFEFSHKKIRNQSSKIPPFHHFRNQIERNIAKKLESSRGAVEIEKRKNYPQKKAVLSQE